MNRLFSFVNFEKSQYSDAKTINFYRKQQFCCVFIRKVFSDVFSHTRKASFEILITPNVANLQNNKNRSCFEGIKKCFLMNLKRTIGQVFSGMKYIIAIIQFYCTPSLNQ